MTPKPKTARGILEEVSGRDFETSDYATSEYSEKQINWKWDKKIDQALNSLADLILAERKPELSKMTCSQCGQEYHSEDIGFNAACEFLADKIRGGK